MNALAFPMTLKQRDKFKRFNDISVNVYILELIMILDRKEYFQTVSVLVRK